MSRHSGPNRRTRAARPKLLLGAFACMAALVAVPADPQQRAIVANEVEVSPSEASLRLEFSDGEDLSVSFAGGRATVDGEFLGTYEPGGAADREWRDLLARVLPLSSGPLALELERWRPDPGLHGNEHDLLAALDGRFASALAGMAGRGRNERAPDAERGQDLLEAMARSEDKEALARALDDVDPRSLGVLVDQDHIVRAGTSVGGGLLLVGGELDVRGRVRGDVIVVDGVLTVAASGRIDGDIHLVESRLNDSGGELGGEVTDVTQTLRREERQAEEEIRAAVRRELGRALPDSGTRRPNPFFWKVRSAARMTFETLVFFAFVGLFAWLVAGRARERVGVVVKAIAHQPARSAAVGFAGGFAVIPVYLAGIAALVVTVIGIPLLVVWVPLFPLVVLAAGFIGLVGIGHHVGRWVLGRGFRWLRWADRGPPSDGKLLGLGTLFAPFVAGEWLRVLPFTGWVGDLLQVVGALAFLLAAVTGFGAVILTRGGTRPTRWIDAFEDYADEQEGLDGWSRGES
ncbi:MAG: hypothetical protein OXQ94_04535 [Gemmatimonadota bacterium]|nr:hypothetical protein [Gemmatimonadota bacterium]MDE2870941.1 hypothetical protein [Gemmatimonadota bacterium]